MTLEEAIAMKKGQKRIEEMSEIDKDICGARYAKHLIIPMSDVYNLRRIAGVLNGLAADFDNLSRRHDYRARAVILEARACVDDANRRIKEMTGKNRTLKQMEGQE